MSKQGFHVNIEPIVSLLRGPYVIFHLADAIDHVMRVGLVVFNIVGLCIIGDHKPFSRANGQRKQTLQPYRVGGH
jgi:hypothetical protein